jgi:nitrogen regulatory protein PII
MKKADKHYKFINSETGYVINYHTIKAEVNDEEIKPQLDNIKAQVAIKNNIFVGNIFWEEIKEAEDNND